MIAFKRYSGDGDVLLIVVNAGNGQWSGNQYMVNLAGDNSGNWQEVFNSQAPVYGGIGTVGNFGSTLSPIQGQLLINLPSWGVLVFEKQ